VVAVIVRRFIARVLAILAGTLIDMADTLYPEGVR